MGKICYSPEEAIQYYLKTYHYEEAFTICKLIKESDLNDHAKASILVLGRHQYRIPNAKKDILIETLETSKPWKEKFPDFEDIYSNIKQLLRHFNGRVTLYDISYRLGISLDLLPEKYVYITSGKVIENAMIILGISKDPGIKRLKIDFPHWIQTLSASQIEDFLCHVEIEITPTGMIFKFKERNIKPFTNYPIDVNKEIIRVLGKDKANQLGF